MKTNDGNPVTGDDFYNRVNEIRKLIGLVEQRQHVNLVAPRRCGKTSLMREVMLRFKAQGWEILEVDFSSCATTKQFFDCLVRKIESRLANTKDWKERWSAKLLAFGKKIKEVKFMSLGASFQSEESGSFAELDESLRELLKGVAAISPRGFLLLGTDEIPIFLSRLRLSAGENTEAQLAVKHEIATLLYWLKQLRQDASLPVVWLHCGSIGLENLVVDLGLANAISGLSHQVIDAFSEEHARGLLRALAESCEFNLAEAAESRMLERLKWFLPYFVQLLFIRVVEPKDDSRRQHPDYPTTEDVDSAYEQLLVEGKIHFSHWDTRLDEQLPKARAALAREILCRIARRDSGIKRDTIVAGVVSTNANSGDVRERERAVKDLLSLLENDGYLMRGSDHVYRFRSPLLRDFWKREFC